MRRFDRVSTISERMLALARTRAWSPPAPCCCRTGSTRRRSRRTWAARTARNSASPPTRSWRCIPATWAASRPAGPGRRGPPPGRRNAAVVRFLRPGTGTGRAAGALRRTGARTLPGPAARRTPGRAAVHGGHPSTAAGAADLVMPSKLTGMLASAVRFGAAPGTELAGVITRCGLLTPLKTRRPWPRPCSAWRKTARPGRAGPGRAAPCPGSSARGRGAGRGRARTGGPCRPAGHRARAPATPDGVRPITPKVRAASAAGPRR